MMMVSVRTRHHDRNRTMSTKGESVSGRSKNPDATRDSDVVFDRST